jgi:hypothetical protein
MLVKPACKISFGTHRAHGDVLVAIDEPGQYREIREVGHLGAGGRDEPILDTNDTIVVNDYGDFGLDLPGFDVHEPAAWMTASLAHSMGASASIGAKRAETINIVSPYEVAHGCAINALEDDEQLANSYSGVDLEPRRGRVPIPRGARSATTDQMALRGGNNVDFGAVAGWASDSSEIDTQVGAGSRTAGEASFGNTSCGTDVSPLLQAFLFSSR